MSSTVKTTPRLMELEGLRGIAAVMVVAFHALVVFYPALFYGSNHPFAPVQHTSLESSLFGNPLGFIFSGAFAVAIFFVLSGFVLTIGFFQTKNVAIIRKLAMKRYLRLMLPALASVLLVWIVLALGLNHGKESAEAITQAGSSSSLWNFHPNLLDAFLQGTSSVFLFDLGAMHYNPVLWTMRYEFIGSFMIFAVVLLFGRLKYRWIIYGALALMMWNSWYLGFIVGMVLADLYATKPDFYKARAAKIVAGLGLPLGLLLGGYPYAPPVSGFYDAIKLPFVHNDTTMLMYMTIGASLTVYAVLTLPSLRAFLAKRKISVLGKYTFSLYLTHLMVIFTVGLTIFSLLVPHIGYSKSAAAAILVSIPCIVAVAWLFERYVDAVSIRLSGQVAERLWKVYERVLTMVQRTPSKEVPRVHDDSGKNL